VINVRLGDSRLEPPRVLRNLERVQQLVLAPSVTLDTNQLALIFVDVVLTTTERGSPITVHG
jgi:hypothetical protein